MASLDSRSTPSAPSSAKPENDPQGWKKALPIGVLAGVPTGLFLQAGFVQTMRERGESVRPSRLMGLSPPGLSYAILRDCFYWAATQKQVQDVKPSWTEALICNFFVIVAPLFLDTLSVRAIDPKFSLPSGSFTTFAGARKLVALGCPPEALFGRMVWIPVYNWVYVSAQQSIGDSTPALEGAGLVIGSVAASVVAYPLFMLKTSLLLEPGAQGPAVSVSAGVAAGAGAPLARAVSGVRSFGCLAASAGLRSMGTTSVSELRASLRTGAGAARLVGSLFAGWKPHLVSNLGPDVLCMGFARTIFGLTTAARNQRRRAEKVQQETQDWRGRPRRRQQR